MVNSQCSGLSADCDEFEDVSAGSRVLAWRGAQQRRSMTYQLRSSGLDYGGLDDERAL